MGLLEQGKLPLHKVGTRRRVRHGDLLAYKCREHEARRQALDELARQGQELGMGYRPHATEMAGFTALSDACVLYPAPPRDLLMRLARTGLFLARWLAATHDEWDRSHSENPSGAANTASA